jgi:hypothetical protein
MFAIKVLTDDRPLLKTQSFRCFHAIQGMSRVVVASALRIGLGVFSFALATSQSGCLRYWVLWQSSAAKLAFRAMPVW